MTFRRLPRFFLTIAPLIAPAGAWLPAAPPSQLLVTETATGLVLEWRAPAAQFIEVAGGEIQVLIEGFSQLSHPGLPQLPFAAVLVAIPPGANPVLEINQIEGETIPLPAQLAIAPQANGVRQAPDGRVIGGAFQPAEKSSAFENAPLELELLGVQRGVRLARLVFYPARPDGDSLRLTTYIRATLRFEGVVDLSASAAAGDPILGALETTVINPDYLVPRPREISQLEMLSPALPDAETTAAIEVSQRALTAITYADLAAAGYPLSGVDPANLHLARGGQEVAWQWDGDGDAKFEAGERLLFFADPRFSRWTETDTYLLWHDGTPGLTMENRSADPAGLSPGTARVEKTFEQNAIYTPECYCAPIPPGRDGDRWVWDRLQRPDRPAASYTIDLPDLDSAQPASLELWLIGYTDLFAAPDHRVDVTFNDQVVGQAEWDGKQAINLSFSLPASALNPGSNTLTLSLPGLAGVSVEGVWLDAFTVRYTRQSQAASESVFFSGEATPKSYTLSLNSSSGAGGYDVTEPDRPVKLDDLNLGPGNSLSLGDVAGGGPHRYWITGEAGITSPTTVRLVPPLQAGPGFPGADYVIITAAEFVPGLSDLIDLRQSQGLAVVVEDLQAIYDAFGGGRPDPQAIRSYLAHAYANWGERPVYVLLVGDGTSDPKGYLDNSSATFIPPYLADVDPWAGETASDNRYVTLEGEDNLPEMLIGRLPVNSLAETQTVVEKIVGYENQPPPGTWANLSVFIADNPDPGGNFPALTDNLIHDRISSPWLPQKLYYQPNSNTPGDVQAGLQDSWNAGAGLVMYTGHASVHQWAVEKFLHLDDIAGLGNASRLPVVVEMTCFTGSFQSPGFATLDEALLRHPQGGAVAAWGPTGLGVATGHESLADGFMASLLEDAQAELGRAILAGKTNLAVQHPYHGDLIDTFTLLGDPATRFASPAALNSTYLPLIQN